MCLLSRFSCAFLAFCLLASFVLILSFGGRAISRSEQGVDGWTIQDVCLDFLHHRHSLCLRFVALHLGSNGVGRDGSNIGAQACSGGSTWLGWMRMDRSRRSSFIDTLVTYG